MARKVHDKAIRLALSDACLIPEALPLTGLVMCPAGCDRYNATQQHRRRLVLTPHLRSPPNDKKGWNRTKVRTQRSQRETQLEVKAARD